MLLGQCTCKLFHSPRPHLISKHLQRTSDYTNSIKPLPTPDMGQMPSSTQWDGSEMPSQAGKIAIVTGANSGIGYVIARALAERGAYVVLACRSESRGRVAEQAMTAYLEQLKKNKNKDEAIGSAEFMQVDMGNLASVRAFAEGLRRRPAVAHVDLLVNNAGVKLPPQPLTADGLESQFGVNHVSHFLLTALLLDLLKAAPAARVIGVGSLADAAVTSLEFDTLARGTDDALARYGKSKLANTMFTHELARRLKAANVTNVISVAGHPGWAQTRLVGKLIESTYPTFLWSTMSWLTKAAVQSSEMGALPILYAATAEGVMNGDYYGPDGRGSRSGYPKKQDSSPLSRNKDEASKLWKLSEELTDVTFIV
jgi:NAD(P)-dependent dehydrogenase (short-subunit alcohol dehydrogenase family)